MHLTTFPFVGLTAPRNRSKVRRKPFGGLVLGSLTDQMCNLYMKLLSIFRTALTFLFSDLQPLIAKERRKVRVLCCLMKIYEQYFTIMADFSEIIWELLCTFFEVR